MFKQLNNVVNLVFVEYWDRLRVVSLGFQTALYTSFRGRLSDTVTCEKYVQKHDRVCVCTFTFAFAFTFMCLFTFAVMVAYVLFTSAFMCLFTSTCACVRRVPMPNVLLCARIFHM